MSTVAERDEELTTEEFAAALSEAIGETVPPSTIRSWRGWRAKDIPFDKRIDGAVRYTRSTVNQVASMWKKTVTPAALKHADRLLPATILSRPLAPADADRAFGLLFEGRGVLAIGTPAPYAARIDSAALRATEALNGLVREAAFHGVIALGIDRAAAAAGGISRVTEEALTEALNCLTADFERQRAQIVADELAAKARIVSHRERRRPLRDAVAAKIAELEQERRDALSLLAELKCRPRDEINGALVANVPADRRAAVLAALGDSGVDHNAEVAELQERQQALAQQIETLKDFATAAPGDYTTLAAWPDLVALADSLKA